MSGLSISSFILIFLPVVIYSAWKKFIFIISPLVLFWVIFTPAQCSGLLGACLDKKLASLISAMMVVVGSIIIFTVKYISFLRWRKKSTGT
ncbi:MAG: hypothetical protein AB1352_02155 [Patescibacteria group bacterium]